jgi:2-iminobutanoate/2-iminopropanoate deaminase
MPVIKHNPPGLYPQYSCYSHAIEIRGDSRLLVISGLNGYLSDGITMPDSFEEQGDIIWAHLGTILQGSGATPIIMDNRGHDPTLFREA